MTKIQIQHTGEVMLVADATAEYLIAKGIAVAYEFLQKPKPSENKLMTPVKKTKRRRK
jgi:hypothetical protein